ncbi:cyclase/dehydrase [Thalassoporum mexicanum PCC 7367]|uniref:SRPBCC family protein n=1 Tax=Thalassoporum mexicanum TaxID=3457544 RepID=UPI00029F8EE0|nr:SRPBCC family protein [Pseudanabaena sp. PCC 7367]AFY70864.1 cyclase/dehydrase [Pseudanabaena sp. PCC 7367]
MNSGKNRFGQLIQRIGLGLTGAIGISLVSMAGNPAYDRFASFDRLAVIKTASAQLFDGPVDRLPPIERDSLRKGRAVVNGEDGKYVGRVLVTASPEVVWQVLTDYDNFEEFIPNLTSSEVLEDNGDRKIVEQVDSRQLFILNIKSTTQLEIKEKAQERIDFELVAGDIESLVGSWQIELVSEYPGATPTQVLITHSVDAIPGSGVPNGIFFEILKGSINETLSAISDEILVRNGN